MKGSFCAILVATVSWLQIAAPAFAAEFTYSTVADTGDSNYKSLVAPAINDNATVAFLASLDEGGSGIFMVTNGTMSLIADNRGPLIKDFFATLSLNDHDEVAFTASLHKDQYDDDYGVFVGDGQSLTTIADSSNSDLSFFMPPSINNAGAVAFSAIVGGTGDAIYVHSGGQLNAVPLPDDPAIGGVVGLTPMNNAGRIAFVAQTFSAMTLFTADPQKAHADELFSLPPAPLVHGSSLGSAIGVNDGNNILYLHAAGAFTVDLLGQVSAVVDPANSEFSSLYPLPVIDENGTYILDQTSLPSINNYGSVAFFAVDEAGKEGIYVTSAPDVFDPVVRAGDSLGGSTVVRLVLAAEGLNNLGQVAFFAELADGREGIFIASIIPEPTSISLAVVLFAFLATERRRWGAQRGRINAR